MTRRLILTPPPPPHTTNYYQGYTIDRKLILFRQPYITPNS
jgi:hypothetical protein